MRHRNVIAVLVSNPLFGGVAYANDLEMAELDAQLAIEESIQRSEEDSMDSEVSDEGQSPTAIAA